MNFGFLEKSKTLAALTMIVSFISILSNILIGLDWVKNPILKTSLNVLMLLLSLLSMLLWNVFIIVYKKQLLAMIASFLFGLLIVLPVFVTLLPTNFFEC